MAESRWRYSSSNGVIVAVKEVSERHRRALEGGGRCHARVYVQRNFKIRRRIFVACGPEACILSQGRTRVLVLSLHAVSIHLQ